MQLKFQRRFRTAATSKMELLVIIVNGFTKSSILDVAAVKNPPLSLE